MQKQGLQLWDLLQVSPVINNSGSTLRVKFLRVHDVLKLIHSLFGISHVSSQVTVEETQHVAVERQADGHAPFVTLRDMQGEIRNKEKVLWNSSGGHAQWLDIQQYQRENAKTTFTSASVVQWDATEWNMLSTLSKHLIPQTLKKTNCVLRLQLLSSRTWTCRKGYLNSFVLLFITVALKSDKYTKFYHSIKCCLCLNSMFSV